MLNGNTVLRGRKWSVGKSAKKGAEAIKRKKYGQLETSSKMEKKADKRRETVKWGKRRYRENNSKMEEKSG